MAAIQTHFDRRVKQVATGGDDAWSEQTVQRIAVNLTRERVEKPDAVRTGRANTKFAWARCPDSG